jgi:lipase
MASVRTMAVLHTHELGNPNGEPLLAVHGITAHGRRFRRLTEEALADRRVLAVDLRGHGRSTSDGPWSVPQHVADLVQTLDAHGVDHPVDVVSHSFGGVLALRLLADHPGRVRRLVLLDPALEFPGDAAAAMATAAIEHPGWATVEEATLARNTGLGDDIHPAVPEEIDEHLVLADDGRYRFRFHRAAVVTAWGEVCLPIPEPLSPVPTLLVPARRADFVTPEVEARLAALLGDHLRTVAVDSGHMVYWERFDETAAAIVDFLAGS